MIYERAAKAGTKESKQALDADALIATAEQARSGGNAQGASTGVMVHVRVDHSALIRGFPEADETCEIPGIGPTSVATAAALATDAFLAVLVTDGVDIKAVSHLGRNIPARPERH